MVPLAGRTVIVVDDGIATGATMHAALNALRAHHPARLVVAVPVAPADAPRRLHDAADAFVSRSEEHTSELQSLMRISYAVFCLKKKNSKKIKPTTTHHA